MDKIYLLILECIENGASDFEVIKTTTDKRIAYANFNLKKAVLRNIDNLIVKEDGSDHFYCADSETMPREEYRLRIEEHEIETVQTLMPL